MYLCLSADARITAKNVLIKKHGISIMENLLQKEIDRILEYLKPNYIAGLSLLGGEPMEPVNQEGILPLLRVVKQTYPEKNIWCYTGYLFDKDVLDKMCKESEVTKEIVSYLDIVVDGEFMIDRKNLKINFRGSDNQRIIDVKKTLDAGEIVHWEREIQ